MTTADSAAPGLALDALSCRGVAMAALTTHIPPGQRVALVGSGADDASRVLSVLAGRTSPATGTALLDGVPVGDDASPSRVGYVSYQHRLVGTLTAVENIAAVLLGRIEDDPAEIWRRAEHQLESLGLPPATWHNLVEQLSGGQQQRVGLARALSATPRLIVLDDPTSELDPATSELIIERIDEACEAGACCVMTTTDPEILASCVELSLIPSSEL